MNMLKKYMKTASHVFMPQKCFSCNHFIHFENKLPLCSICLKKITLNPLPHCQKCGHSGNILPLKYHGCNHCQKRKFYFEKAYAPFLYEGIIKDLLHQFKFFNRLELSSIIVSLAEPHIRKNPFIDKADAIVPVPMHWSKHLLKQMNHSHLLAKKIGHILKKPVVPALIKKCFTKRQTKLSRKERLQNVNNSIGLKARQALRDTNVLLIDDVFTTGATANECAKILHKAGCHSVSILTIARGR